MSDIILLVYMADVLPSIGGIIWFTAFSFILAYMGEWLVYGISERDMCKIKHHWLAGTATMMFVVSAAIPSKQTIYMIGGITASQKLAATIGDSELASKTMQLLNQELDKIIADNTKSASKQDTK